MVGESSSIGYGRAVFRRKTHASTIGGTISPPSDELREWFDHDPAKWSAFERGYRYELGEIDEDLAELRSIARSETLTLLFAASDVEHNNARVLASVLEAGLE